MQKCSTYLLPMFKSGAVATLQFGCTLGPIGLLDLSSLICTQCNQHESARSWGNTRTTRHHFLLPYTHTNVHRFAVGFVFFRFFHFLRQVDQRSSTKGMSQIWLEISQDLSRKFLESWVSFGQPTLNTATFTLFFPQNMATLYTLHCNLFGSQQCKISPQIRNTEFCTCLCTGGLI